MNELIGITICILLFVGSITFLQWLAIVHPPKDMTEEYKKIDDELEAKLKAYKEQSNV